MKTRATVASMLAAVSLLGCGNGSGTSSPSHARQGYAPGTQTAGSSDGAPSEQNPRHPALAPLRPTGADDVLAPLERGARSSTAYADAARFYAGTDAAGMALIYGLTCAAISSECAGDPPIATAMTNVLRERVTVTEQGDSRRLSTRLAPGSMPAIQASDGSLSAPVAHLFELQLGPALVVFDGTWTLASVMEALRNYASIVAQGATPVSAELELDRWLARLADAGHLDGFVAQVFGPPFSAELASWQTAHPGAVEEARAWMVANPFAPSQVPLPDDLVRIR